MVLKSTDSLDLYRNNKPYDFHVHLPIPLTLIGHWTVALLEACLPSTKGTLTFAQIFAKTRLSVTKSFHY